MSDEPNIAKEKSVYVCFCLSSEKKERRGREKEQAKITKECGVNAFGREKREVTTAPLFQTNFIWLLCVASSRVCMGYVLLLFSLFTFYAS